MEGSGAMSVPSELLAEHLDVYDTRDGLWNPDHGGQGLLRLVASPTVAPTLGADARSSAQIR